MHKFSTAPVRQLLVALWLVISFGWIASDHMVRDGDEEGHVGAAELYLEDLQGGDLIGYGLRAWTGHEMGEYPQVFAATVGGWWWLQGGGHPGRVAVRGICLLGLLLASVATGRIARRTAGPDQAHLAEVTAMSTVLLLPLCNGLVRHFMPEGLLVGATALALLAAIRIKERPTFGRALALGAAIGLGLLVKQTFLVAAAVPLIYLVAGPVCRQPKAALGICLALAAVAGPWVGMHLGAQATYLAGSTEGHGSAGWLAHLVYYPWTAAWLGLGPVLAIGSGAALVVLIRQRERRSLMLGGMWLVGGLLLFTLLPKKYPRLIAPLLPGVAIWISAAIVRLERPHRWLGAVGAVAAGWLVWASTSNLPLHIGPSGVDPGCPQRWVRPPLASDLGLSAIEDAVSAGDVRTISVLDGPEIPCAVQTTQEWSAHLGPHLRRGGHEVRITDTDSTAADLIVDWRSGPGTAVDVPALGARFWIRQRATLSP